MISRLSDNRKLLRSILLWVALLASLILLVQVSPQITNAGWAAIDDFSNFWQAGRRLMLGGNPYNPILMSNPPWALSILIPFSLLDYPASRLLWFIFCTGCVFVSAQLFWQFYQAPGEKKWVPWLVSIGFAPVIAVLGKGQITPVLLVAILGFLFFEEKNKFWLAGIFAALGSVKPQIYYLFWIALLFWTIQNRNYQVAVGFFFAIFIMMGFVLIFNPQIISDYISGITSQPLTDWATPTFGGYLRLFVFGLDKFYIQFVPVIFGLIWFVITWIKNIGRWNWSVQMPMLMLVSLTAGAYAWTYDQVVLLVAIIQAFIWITVYKKSTIKSVMVVSFVLLNLGEIILHRFLDEFWFLWLAPSYLIWYLIIQKSTGRKGDNRNVG